MNWFNKKKEIIDNHSSDSLAIVEFSISSYCNLKCSFCPISSQEDRVHEDMDPELFKKTIKDLLNENFDGLIAFSGFCESTLNPNFKEFILYSKKMLNCKIVLVTNGITLTQKNFNEYKKCGLDYTVISAYTIEDFDRLKKIQGENIFIQKRFIGGFENNRGGYFTDTETPLNKECYYPFYTTYIDYTGDVLFCSHNFNKKNIIGNVKDNHLNNIIHNNPKLIDIKLKLIDKKRCNIDACRGCNVDGTAMGGKYLETWKKSQIFKNN